MAGLGVVSTLRTLSQALSTLRKADRLVVLDRDDPLDAMLEQDPELEAKVCSVKGLMSELFTHKKKKVKSIRKRKNSLGAADDTQKKRVRFNISSTVYEDASAMADDSVSIIEPLSIYSNVSPPGELADVSLPHSAYSVP